MPGADVMQESLFTTVHLETFVPTGHPLRVIRALMGDYYMSCNTRARGVNPISRSCGYPNEY